MIRLSSPLDGFVSNNVAGNVLVGSPPSQFAGRVLPGFSSSDLVLQQLCYKRLLSVSAINSTAMTRPRKRVRFSEAPKDTTAHCAKSGNHCFRNSKIRRTSLELVIAGEQGNSNSHVSPQEKIDQVSNVQRDDGSSSWYQKSDFRRFLGEATRLVSTCANEEYLELLSCTYKSCCLEDAADNTLSDQFAEELALNMAATSVASPISPPCSGDQNSVENGADKDCARGLERLMSPLLVGCTSKQRRKTAIRAVVLAQETCSKSKLPHVSCGERSELLRIVSERHTVSAKKFAKALAVVDATSALLEYTG